MGGGNKKVDLRKKENLYTYPLISSGNLKEIQLSIIQINILKYISQKGNVTSISRSLHCSKANIRYHLNKLKVLNLVSKGGEFDLWKITNEGLQIVKGGKERRLTKKLKVDSKGLLLQSRVAVHEGLTEKEEEIYNLIVNEFKTPLQAALLLNCSKQNVYKILNKIKKKGYLGGGNKKVDLGGVCIQPLSPPRIRLHNMRWTIKILHKLSKHKGVEAFILDGNKIKVWEHSIEIYSQKDFWGDDPQEAYNSAMEYWYKIFIKLENRCNVELLKNDLQNIQLTKCEFANTNNEIAKEYIRDGKKLKVLDSNGEVWALIDNSHGLFEFETVRSRSAKPDMDRVLAVLNDYRDNPNVMTPKEMQEKVEFIINIVGESSIMQNNIFKILEKITKELTKINEK